MSFFRKDTSWVNKVIFPAPRSSYNPDTFDAFKETVKLFWVPRRNAAVRRPAESAYDENSVPCIWLPCPAPGARYILIYCHGNSEDLGQNAYMLSKLRDYLKVHVLGIEYPGYGISVGQPSEAGINNDLLVVYSFLTGVMKWPSQDILLYGFSIGTGPTTHLAAHQPVGGLVLLAPYTSIRDMVSEVLPKGVGKVAQFLISNRFENQKEIAKVKCPTLIIHGRSDELIPHTHSESLIEKCGAEKKQLYLADTLRHCYDDDDLDSYVLFPVMDFFDLKGGVRKTCTFPPYVFKKPPPVPEDAKEAGAVVDKKGAPAAAAAVPATATAAALPAAAKGPQLPNSQAVPQPDGSVSWQCAACTFLNAPQHVICEICLAPKAGRHSSNKRSQPTSSSAAAAAAAVAGPQQPDMSAVAAGLDAAAAVESKADDDALWSCSVCTFENPDGAAQCEMCGSPAPPSVASNAVAASSLPATASSSSLSGAGAGGAGSESWRCDLCTFINKASRVRCKQCQTPRPVVAASASSSSMSAAAGKPAAAGGGVNALDLSAAGGVAAPAVAQAQPRSLWEATRAKPHGPPGSDPDEPA